MNDLAYSGVNTTVRILEQQLLSKEQLNGILVSTSLQQALEALQKTSYEIDVQEVLESRQFDKVLDDYLKVHYEEVLELIPDASLLDVFSIRYTYHNLKVLLKSKFSGRDLTHLCVPLGRYSMETLNQLVETQDSLDVPPIMIEGVREAYADFENFGRLEAADVFMDRYYFKHLRFIDRTLNQDIIHQIVNIMIDMENMTILIRANQQNQSRSFLIGVLSSEGTIDKTLLIDEVLEKGTDALLELYRNVPYYDRIVSILESEEHPVFALELLKEELIYHILQEATFEPFGPLPSLAYIHAIEMEVKNLRLLLVGVDNEFSKKQLEERMRPVYVS